MPSFTHRSAQKEWLDSAAIPFADIRQNLKELNRINQHLGGHDVTLDGVVALLQHGMPFNKSLHITEIGCGGGDNLRAIEAWATRLKIPLTLTGIDINEACIQFAKALPANKNIRFICADYRQANIKNTDVIFSSLFCHHFNHAELVEMIKWMEENSISGFFINDLHRHPLAYHGIRFLTGLFSKSYLVKHDAPLSVIRSFKKKDWESLFGAARLSNYKVEWKWAFRWLVTYYK